MQVSQSKQYHQKQTKSRPSFEYNSQNDNKKKSKIKFRPIKYLKLYNVFAEITQVQLLQNKQIMFPIHFPKAHQNQLKTYLFQVQVEDQYKKWTIIKRLPQLIQLQKNLKQKYPNKNQIFPIPHLQEKDIQRSIVKNILDLFGTFLNSIVQIQLICKQKCFLLFIENLISQGKKKVKTYFQRSLNKKAGGRHTQSNFVRILYNLVNWRHKYFTITKQGVYYTESYDSFQVQQMILFNQQFSLLYGQIKTGYTYGIVINSSHRVLQIDGQNIFNFLLFIYFLQKAIIQNQSSKEKYNRFKSFSPVRKKSCQSKFFIDGQNYFKAVYEQMIKAKKQIYITGWFLPPYIYLIQNYQTDQFRFDKVLKKIAQSGVKIYIIMYNAPAIALYLNPQISQSYFNSLHHNIKSLKHPNYMFIPFLWSHHQKLVVIDQKIAFLGGLDIAYGRIDNNQHKLTDQEQKIWKGVEYCNFRITDIIEPHNYQKCSINRLMEPRMPWHDISVMLSGPSVLDLSRHFTQYWNYVNFQLHLSERQLIIYTGIHEQQLKQQDNSIDFFEQSISITIQKNKIKTLQNYEKKQIVQDIKFIDQQQIIQPKNKKQKKFSSFSGSKNNIITLLPQLNRLKSTIFQGSSEYQQDQKLIQKNYYINFIKQNNNSPIKNNKVQSMNQINIKPIKQDKQNISQQLFVRINDNSFQQSTKSKIIQNKQSHQILRSASLWGLGLEYNKEEKSILEAYYNIIQTSKHFIYIQNQFFISVENQISLKIIQRINLAYQKKQNFKVMIIIPFLPAFEGQVQDQYAAVIRVQIDLIYKTICKGQNSIFHKLSHIPNLHNYLGIYCLRTHAKINNIPVTQIVYVHSKVMIIDDNIALIGSANINDRSLLGTRDSQLAVVIEDGQKIQISYKDQNQNHQRSIIVNKFAHQLRKSLYMEHFGLTNQQAEYFNNQNVWQMIQFNAERNQKIYRKIFACYPDNNIKKYCDIEKIQAQAQVQRYEQLIPLIKGYACPFQSQFLCEQNLELKTHQREYYLPFINFT